MAFTILEKLRGFLGTHDGGDISDVKDSVERMAEITHVSPYISGTGDAIHYFSPRANCKLVDARFVSTAVTASTAANTVFLTVTTNGVEVANVNTDGDSLNALAANTVYDLSVNTTNSFVDADELVLMQVTHQSGNNCNGYFVLTFRQED